MKNLKYIFTLIILMTLAINLKGQIISYPSNCLEMKLVFLKEGSRMDSTKIIQLEDNNFIDLFTKSSSDLNIEIVFFNNCNLNVSVPQYVDIDMPNDLTFWIEAEKNDSGRVIKLENYYEYDYRKISKCMTIKPKQTKVLDFKHPFGVYSKGKGEYRFRIVLNSMYCNLSSNDWRYYYSNWIILKIE